MRKTKITTWMGVGGWIFVIIATLMFIYVSKKVIVDPKSPTKSEIIIFALSVIIEALAFLLLILWTGVL